MNLPNILSNRQFKGVAIAVAIFTLALVVINILVVGGDLFIYNLNSGLNAPLAIIITISAIAVFRLMSTERHNRILWLGIIIGWGLWALAETIWTIYSILGQEVPYPSLADLFWVIGYIPMGIGLSARTRTMPARPNRSQNIIIAAVSIIAIVITTIYIFVPTIQDFDPQRLFESILNFIYPLADLFLLIIVWRLFFTFEKGDYGFGWRILTLGFISMTIADLLFAYTTWQGSYYPGGTANLVSRFGVDIPYTFSYLLWFLGIQTLHILLKEERPVEPGARVRVVRNYGHILIYTRNDDAVIDISPNFNRFFESMDVKGKLLSEVLKIPEEESRAILEKLRRERRVADLPLKIQNRSGVVQDVRLSGLAVVNPQGAYMGSNLLLRMRTADLSFDDALNQETRSMARYLLEKSGSSHQDEIGQFLSDYYLAYIKSLLDAASHRGGTNLSQALLGQLQKAAQNWKIQIEPETILDHRKYTLEVLQEALPALLETAIEFVSDIAGPTVAEACIKEVDGQFSALIHADAERYKKSRSKF